MLRQLVKSGIAWSLAGSGADRLVQALRGSGRVPLVLGYHRVVEDFAASAPGALPGLVISRAMLERQLDWLARRYRFVSLDEVGRRIEEGPGSRGPTVAITFDDGYADFYENAYPLLRRKGIPAAVFVVTDLLGSPEIPLYDRLYILLSRAFGGSALAARDLRDVLNDVGYARPLPVNAFAALEALQGALPQNALLRVVAALESGAPVDGSSCPALRPLTWDMVRTMRASGLVTIGSHTRTHALLTREDEARVREETASSRCTLEETLGETIEHFAYPGGRFDDIAVAAVRDAGYRFAYTICPHRDPKNPSLTIPRRMLWESSCLDVRGRFSGALMSGQATGLFDLMARCAHPARERGTARAAAI